MSNLFNETLYDLGEKFDEEIALEGNSCRIIFDGDIDVQFELDSTEDYFYVCAFLNTLPPGPFRKEVLKSALMANAAADETASHFCYINDVNKLGLQAKLPVSSYDAEKLYSYLEVFVEKAREWQNAITNGQTHPASYDFTPKKANE
ncbi:MAG: hypothetical protein S4CHLAM102_07830 [Chlamydiia bacterium]|nr:hypothetical protein [Chlamydiia bacterium]